MSIGDPFSVMSGTLEQKEQLDFQIFSFLEVARTCVVIDIA